MRFVLIVFCFMSVACSTIQATRSPSVSVNIDDPQRIRFSGKGAGAGIMLSSSMGPMGIAIGVAIDEGIGKDIDASFTAAGHNLRDLITASFELKMKDTLLGKAQGIAQERSVELDINRIASKTTSGEGDPVVPSVTGSIKYLGEVVMLSEIQCPEFVLSPVQLSRIKESGDVTYQSLSQYFSGVFGCWSTMRSKE